MRRVQHYPHSDDLKLDFSTLKRLLPYLLEFKKRIVLAIICLLLAKVASVGLPVILKHIVDTLNLDTVPTEVSLPLGLLLAYGVARFSNVIFGEIRDTLFGRVTERAMRRIALRVFIHLHRLDIAFHLDRQTGGVSRDIERGTSGISFLLRFMVFNIIPTLLEISFIVALLLYNYSVWFAVIIVVAVVLYISFSVVATEWRTGFVRQANEADSMSNTRAVDSLLNYETVKYFNKESQEAKIYDEQLEKWETARRKNRLSLFALNGGQALIIATSLTSMMVLAAYLVQQESMTIGDFVLINAYMMQIFLPLNFLGFVYREMKGSLANIERLFYLLGLKPTIVDKKDAQALQVERGNITFEAVSFSYNKGDRQVLKNLSFVIPAGKKTAIVGASGSGKSTIARLLYRFYACDTGQICIDDQNISEVTLLSLRQAIGIVPQDTVLFNASLRENLLYGVSERSHLDLVKVLKMAHLDGFVARLKDGLETTVGERGMKLSGGEKQRVAIARTILKSPRVWLFDEATSSLDSEAEQIIVDAIDEVTEGLTTLVIAHRLSTVVNADNILVIDDGQLVEQGSHRELYQLGGYYRRLWDLQQEG